MVSTTECRLRETALATSFSAPSMCALIRDSSSPGAVVSKSCSPLQVTVKIRCSADLGASGPDSKSVAFVSSMTAPFLRSSASSILNGVPSLVDSNCSLEPPSSRGAHHLPGEGETSAASACRRPLTSGGFFYATPNGASRGAVESAFGAF